MINVKVYVSPDESKVNDMGSMMIEGIQRISEAYHAVCCLRAMFKVNQHY